MVERHRTVLIVLAALLLLGRVGDVAAQSGACPPGTETVTTPHGTYPGGSTVCLIAREMEAGANVYNDYLDKYPCEQQIEYPGSVDLLVSLSRTFYIVPPVDVSLNAQARVRFMAMFGFLFSPPTAGDFDHFYFVLDYFDPAGVRRNTESHFVSEYPVVTTYDDSNLVSVYYDVFLIDEVITTSPDAAGGGYIRVTFPAVPDTLFGVNTGQGPMRIGSIQASSTDSNFPDYCTYRYLPPWPTSTPWPTPTQTPTGTYTPPTATSTPIAYPTSAGGTVTPWPTPTTGALVFPTVQSESTPTPWPAYSIPPVVWPTAGPTIMAGAIPTLDTSGLNLGGLADDIESDWADVLAASESGLDTTITATTGIAAPDTIATEITDGISKPIAYAKTIGVYAPNVAGFISRFMYLAVWVVFSRNARFFLSIAVKLFELVRRVWEMIPFVG